MSLSESALGSCAISDSVRLLSKLPRDFHWTLNCESVLLAIAHDQPVVYGRAGELIRSLLRLAGVVKLDWLVVWAVGLFEVCRLNWKHRTAPESRVDSPPLSCLFVGFGAGSEQALLAKYSSTRKGVVRYVNQVEPESLGACCRVSTMSGLRRLWNSLLIARRSMNSLPASVQPWRTEFLTFIAKRIGYYSFMQSWFSELKRTTSPSLEDVAFLAADTAAFAAASAGLHCTYLQHGLITRHGIPAQFSRIEAITVDEAEFLKVLVPDADVVMRPEATQLSPTILKDTVVVTSIYGSHSYMSSIDGFIQWLVTRQIPIVVKPHPRESLGFWTQYAECSKVQLLPASSSFGDIVHTVLPRLVVSWFSTTLAEALTFGIIPVTVCQDDDAYLPDMVYPLLSRSLRWPRDVDTIASVLNSDDRYADVLAKLRNVVAAVHQ